MMTGVEKTPEQQEIAAMQQQMAMQTLQLEIAKLEAEVRKLQSEAAVNIAKVQDTAEVQPQMRMNRTAIAA